MQRRKRRNAARRNQKRYQSPGLNFGRRTDSINAKTVKEIFIWLIEILIVIFIAAVCVIFVGFRVSVVGHSMSPTLDNGENILVNRFIYKLVEPKQDDIIVFLPNGNDKSHYYIKRVIAVPGDRVLIKDGMIYVNDLPFEEKIDADAVEDALIAEEEIQVKEDEYFVLGDNRNNSEDSRYANIGNVKKEHITGKAWFVISPWKKMGFL